MAMKTVSGDEANNENGLQRSDMRQRLIESLEKNRRQREKKRDRESILERGLKYSNDSQHDLRYKESPRALGRLGAVICWRS